MIRKTIVFRADASKNTGYGHFIRSLALAGYLKGHFECFFASFNKDNYGEISQYQESEILKVCTPLKVSGETIAEFDRNFLSKLRPDYIIVLDNYYYSTEYQREIINRGCKLVCLDEMHDRHMVCDMLITLAPLRRKDFSIEPTTIFVGGIKRTFLRDAFFKATPKRDPIKKICKVVIAMGGADAFNLTDKMIGIVHSVLPTAEIDVIAGETVIVHDDAMSIARIHRLLPAEKIVDLFDNADIGVFPASTICSEALSRRLPVAAGFYVDNQLESYNYGVEKGLYAPLGNLLDDANMLRLRLMEIVMHRRLKPTAIDFTGQREEIVQLFYHLSNL